MSSLVWKEACSCFTMPRTKMSSVGGSLLLKVVWIRISCRSIEYEQVWNGTGRVDRNVCNGIEFVWNQGRVALSSSFALLAPKVVSLQTSWNMFVRSRRRWKKQHFLKHLLWEIFTLIPTCNFVKKLFKNKLVRKKLLQQHAKDCLQEPDRL